MLNGDSDGSDQVIVVVAAAAVVEAHSRGAPEYPSWL